MDSCSIHTQRFGEHRYDRHYVQDKVIQTECQTPFFVRYRFRICNICNNKKVVCSEIVNVDRL